ncbi:MAG: hypothetical protein HQM08_10560 [Candidatus Riflebacteria bacterium]|nr:hypothetical protein [Candidatus Riflebacteria bacterium]
MILLLSILFTLGILFSSQFKATKKLRNKEIAIALAQQAVEVLRSSPYSIIDDADSKDDSVEYDLNHDSGPEDLLLPKYKAGSIEYLRKVEVKSLSLAGGDKKAKSPVKYVTVSVFWKTPDGQDESITLSTTISNLN